MITPVMVDRIGWATYLVYTCTNFGFLPFVWLFYPETRRRSLEEIDLIFAKGYTEGIGYVRASHELPFLSDAEVERMARAYGVGEEVGADQREEEVEKGEVFEAGKRREGREGREASGAADAGSEEDERKEK